MLALHLIHICKHPMAAVADVKVMIKDMEERPLMTSRGREKAKESKHSYDRAIIRIVFPDRCVTLYSVFEPEMLWEPLLAQPWGGVASLVAVAVFPDAHCPQNSLSPE